MEYSPDDTPLNSSELAEGASMNREKRIPTILAACTFLMSLVGAGCTPPASWMQPYGLTVTQTLEQPLPTHAKVRVRVGFLHEEGVPRTSDSRPAGEEVARQGVDHLFPELEIALVEALTSSSGLLLDVVGWEEFQAYLSYQEVKQSQMSAHDREFGMQEPQPGDRLAPSDLVDQDTWEACAYEVVAQVVECAYASGSALGSVMADLVPIQEAKVIVHLRDRTSGETLSGMTLLARGGRWAEDIAQRFAQELEQQIWGERENKPRSNSGI